MFGSSRELWEACGAASTVLIDISIGLTDSPDQRECDFEARRALGPRRSSVFTPPSRAAMEARSYREASTLNFRETGRKLNLQTWNISEKIREVDELLRGDGDARSRVREVHPDVCFWDLAGGQPMNVRKKDRDSLKERLDLLSRYDANSPETYEEAMNRFPRHELARDDILDSMVAALTADSPSDDLRTLPTGEGWSPTSPTRWQRSPVPPRRPSPTHWRSPRSTGWYPTG